MQYLIAFIAAFILLVIQSGILLPLSITPVNLLLLLLVVSVLYHEFEYGLTLAFLSGVMLDFVSGSADGIMSLSIIMVFLVIYTLVNSLIAREPSLPILFASVAGATMLFFLMIVIFNRAFALFDLGSNIRIFDFLLIELPKELIFNLILTYPIMRYYLFVTNVTQPIRNPQ